MINNKEKYSFLCTYFYLLVVYLKDTIDEFQEKIEGQVKTPTKSSLFEANKNCSKLEEKAAHNFYKTVAKLLFTCKRVCPDIQTTVIYLRARIRKPGENDYKNLKRGTKIYY